MEHRDVSRRTLLKGGGAALAGLSLQVAGPARAFQRDDDREQHAWDDETSLTRRNPWDSPATWSSRGSTNRPGLPPRILPEASSSGKSSTPG